MNIGSLLRIFLKKDCCHSIFMIGLLVLINACSALPEVVVPDPKHAEPLIDDIYIVSHGWHTGIVLPAAAIQARLPELKSRFDGVAYLEFGWGDKGFYQAAEITTGLTLQAIFWPTESVMHVVAVNDKAPLAFPHSQSLQICMSDVEYASLLTFIENSFQHTDTSGDLVSMRHGIYGDSQFYAGVGDYYLMNTCNKWTAKALKSAGMDIWSTFKLTAGSIMNYLEDSTRLAVQGRCGP